MSEVVAPGNDYVCTCFFLDISHPFMFFIILSQATIILGLGFLGVPFSLFLARCCGLFFDF